MGGAREVQHLVGLLLGTEDDWPRAYQALLGIVAPVRDADGTEHRFATERLTIEPFSLRASHAPTSSSTVSRTGTTTRASGSRRLR